MAEAQISGRKIHKKKRGKEDEEEVATSLAVDEVGVREKVVDNVEDLPETRAKQLRKKRTAISNLHKQYPKSTCLRTMMKIQTPKSASSAPRPSSIQPSHPATTAPAISAQFA